MQILLDSFFKEILQLYSRVVKSALEIQQYCIWGVGCSAINRDVMKIDTAALC